MNEVRISKYGKFLSRPLRFLYGYPLVAVISHWIFQSLFYMEATERWFKLSLDLILMGLAGFLLNLWLPWQPALIFGFLTAHTLNFLFNGHLWGVLKNYGYVRIAYEDYTRYVSALAWRANQVAAIERIVIVGSLARQEWTPQSDLDARILCKRGAFNNLRVCLFLVKERTRALLQRFPLDLYALDHQSALNLAPGEIFEVRMNTRHVIDKGNT